MCLRENLDRKRKRFCLEKCSKLPNPFLFVCLFVFFLFVCLFFVCLFVFVLFCFVLFFCFLFFVFFVFNLIGLWGYLYWKVTFQLQRPLSGRRPSSSSHLVAIDLEGLDEGLLGLGLSWSWCPRKGLDV